MEPSDLPSTLPSPERLSVMLSEVGREFRSGDAYEAAWAEGVEVSERTLRDDLKAAAEAGILERTGSGKWKKTIEPPSELKKRIGVALLAAGTWKTSVTSGSRLKYEGPAPDKLRETVEQFAPVFDEF